LLSALVSARPTCQLGRSSRFPRPTSYLS